ncbi:NAD(P)H-flavin reductase [Rheinheimera nanhaiensis]|uniref:NAD(P)H-flavin reductase n=1 Tax=Rheinheimera nanhaiensis E407-8 TaxID=562729 RepID=I1E2A8_9GAMM|nr:NAD(P)H-flavin reductase [Rheinheimera nanhaiensis]GAB60436.1 NAD(P)H-flavin reductase [Rheinheimera nanhaiensis E407-8]
MTTTLCTVDLIEALTPTVNRVLLTPNTPVSFSSGQYLQLCLTDSDKRPFSIASIPGAKQLELHIGGSVNDQYASQALAHLLQQYQLQQPVLAEIGLGQAQFRADSERPVILVAGGTGFSYVYSIAQSIAAAKLDQPVFVYWGVREQSALYHASVMQQWAAQHSKYRFIPVVQQPDTNWQGRTGMVHQAVLEDFISLEAYDIYVAGPFAMAGVVRDAFIEQGAHREHMYADAFAYI